MKSDLEFAMRHQGEMVEVTGHVSTPTHGTVTLNVRHASDAFLRIKFDPVEAIVIANALRRAARKCEGKS